MRKELINMINFAPKLLEYGNGTIYRSFSRGDEKSR